MRHIQVPPINSLHRCHEYAHRDRFIASSEQACSFSVRSNGGQGSAVLLVEGLVALVLRVEGPRDPPKHRASESNGREGGSRKPGIMRSDWEKKLG